MIKGRLLIPDSAAFDGKFMIGHDGSNLRFSSDGGLTFEIIHGLYSPEKVRATINRDGKAVLVSGVPYTPSYQTIIGYDQNQPNWGIQYIMDNVGSIKMSRDYLIKIITLDEPNSSSLYSHNNSNWSAASYGVTKNGMVHLALSDDGQYAFTASNLGTTYPAVSSNVGMSWTDIVSVSSGKCGGVAMSCDGYNMLITYINEYNSAFFVGWNYGNNWQMVTSPYNLWAVDPCISHYGQYWCFTECMGSNYGIYFSSNGGTSWQKATWLPDFGQLVFPFYDENIWFLFPYNGSGYYRSDNAGNTWTYINLGHNLYYLAANKFNPQ